MKRALTFSPLQHAVYHIFVKEENDVLDLAQTTFICTGEDSKYFGLCSLSQLLN